MKITNWFVGKDRHTQGIVGELTAKLMLTHLGYDCATPEGIHIPYDLLAVKDGAVFKIQVKTTNRIVGGTENRPRYEVYIATSGGNTRSNTVRGFDPSLSDFLFVMVGSGDCWLIPTSKIQSKTQLYVGSEMYQEFQVC